MAPNTISLTSTRSLRAMHKSSSSTELGIYSQRSTELKEDQSGDLLSPSKVPRSQMDQLRAGLLRAIHELSRKCEGFVPVRAVHKAFPGWQYNAFNAIVIAVVVLTINATFSVVVATTRKVDDFGIVTLFEGDCSQAKNYNEAVAHLIVNVISTVRIAPFGYIYMVDLNLLAPKLLLASSNYYMQILASPTRSEIDSAHRKGQW